MASDISTSCVEYLAILLLFSFQAAAKVRSRPNLRPSRCSQRNQLRGLLISVFSIPCIFSPWQIYGEQYTLCLALKLFLYAVVLILGMAVAVPVAFKIRAVLQAQINRNSGATKAVREQAKRSLVRLRRLFLTAFSLTLLACGFQLYAAVAILVSGRNNYGEKTFNNDAYLAFPPPRSLSTQNYYFRGCQYCRYCTHYTLNTVLTMYCPYTPSQHRSLRALFLPNHTTARAAQ
jgi:hypothetical protein